MDEARLKRIEASTPAPLDAFDDLSLAWNTIHELIAALREAWEELGRLEGGLVTTMGRAKQLEDAYEAVWEATDTIRHVLDACKP